MGIQESHRLVVWRSVDRRTFAYTKYTTNYQGVEKAVSIGVNLTREDMIEEIRRYPEDIMIRYEGTEPLVR